MDIRTSIYSIDEVPEEIKSFLDESLDQINILLNLTDYGSDSRDAEDIMLDFDEYPFEQTLTPYLEDLLDRNIAKKYESLVASGEDIDFSSVAKLAQIRNLVAEQNEYLYVSEEGCEKFMITAHVDENFYGLIYCFFNKEYPDTILIQGISKTLKYTLTDFFEPNTYNYPKLNSILMSSIECLAKLLGAKRIVVAPIGRQGDILTKHYGFTKTDMIQYPCKIIQGYGATYVTYYEKIVP